MLTVFKLAKKARKLALGARSVSAMDILTRGEIEPYLGLSHCALQQQSPVGSPESIPQHLPPNINWANLFP